MDLRTHAAALLTGIYAIVNDPGPDPVALTRDVLDAGVRIVQYRAKDGVVGAHAQAIRELTRAYGALFILNDAWARVRELDADGVHVGPDDVALDELRGVREAIGARLLGVSCGTKAEARIAERAGADYVGVGSVFATASKADAGAPIGIQGLRSIAAVTRLPVAAIGGITLENLAAIRASGVAMAAVISAIAASGDARSAGARLVQAWNERAD